MATAVDAADNALINADIHRALQHVIGQVNNTYELSAAQNVEPEVSQKKKKRKRDTKEPVGVNSDDEEGRKRKKKKKKKKKKKQAEDIAESSLAQGAEDSIADNEQPTEVPIDPQLSGQNPASTAAFLSALVAAASATSDPQQSQEPLQHYPNYQQYQYPPPHGYPPLHGSPQQPIQQPQQSLFPTPLGPSTAFPADVALAGLNTNEDVLRALQDLDLSKIAVVLRSLGDAANAANVSLGYPQQGDPSASSSGTGNAPGQHSASSAAILGHSVRDGTQPTRDEKRARAGALAMSSMPHVGQDEGQDPEHAHMLANKWMNAGKLAELVKTKGLLYKKGKFSTVEEAQIKNAIDNYRISRGLTDEQVNEIIFTKGTKNKDTAFWSEITSQVPGRPIIAVYHHIRRTHHPMKQQGKWMPAEDAFLKIAVAELGQSWEKVSLRVGRMAADCRDRWRNHISNREIRVSGQWSKEEEEELTRIVTKMTIAQGKDQDNDVFWGQVAQLMGNKRGRQQCRIKWTDSLSKTLKNEGHKPRWSQQDAFILVHKVASMNVRDDSEIDWKLLSDNDWNLWSAHSLQRRWLTLKRSIRGYEDMSHQEIMDILRTKKAQAPPPPIAPRKSRVNSAVMVPPEESEVELEVGPHMHGQPVMAGEGPHMHEALTAEPQMAGNGGRVAEDVNEVLVDGRVEGGSPSSSSSDDESDSSDSS